MHDDPRRGRYDSDGDDELFRALHTLGDRYDPDVAAINHRMRHSERGFIQHTSTLQTSHHRQGWLARPVMLPIAAVILVVGGFVALMPGRSADNGSAGTEIAQAGAVTSGSTQSPSPTGKPTELPPARLGPAVSATEASTGPSNSSGPDHQGAPVGRQPTVRIWPVSARAPMAETLSRFGRYDWIALGARSDRRQVRAAESARHPAVTVDQPEDANVVYGPFRLSWQGGVPEDRRDNEGTWLRADGQTGWSMALRPSSTTVRYLRLYLGSSNLKASVLISGKDFDTRRFELQKSGSTPTAAIVEVNVPRTSHVVYLHFSGTATAAENANFYLAGLTLRTNNQETARTG